MSRSLVTVSRYLKILLPGLYMVLLLLQLIVADANAYSNIVEYPISPDQNLPLHITSGGDNAVWFTERDGTGQIGRISPMGSIQNYSVAPVDANNAIVTDITNGPDGNLWFTVCVTFSNGTYGDVGKLTPSGNSTLYPVTNGGCPQTAITTGSDGNLWFTTLLGGTYAALGKVTTSGVVTPIVQSFAPYTVSVYDLTTGSDGNLWFADFCGNAMFKMSTDGIYQKYSMPTSPGGCVEAVTEGPDGNVWYTKTSGTIGKVTPTGDFIEYPAVSYAPYGITTGPDGALWFTDSTSVDRIGRISTSGSVTEYTIPTDGAGAYDITSGPDNAIWFTEAFGKNIGKIVIQPNAPTNLTAISPTVTPHLQWAAVDNANDYYVYRDGVKIGSATDTFYTDSAAIDGQHTYHVTAVNGSLESLPSNNVDVLVDKSAPLMGSVTWSANPIALGQNATFSVPATDSLSGVSGGEYYISSTDPGQGNGVPAQWDGTNLSATLGPTLATGVYDVHIRAQDAAGNWSDPVTTMLVVYNPGGPGVTGKNKKDLVPSLANGDILPGLVSAGQTDVAQYGFTVGFKNGSIDPQSDFHISYNTGTNCNKPTATNCHSLDLNATGFQWLVIDGSNNSHGRFQGSATVTIDGITTTNPFSADVLDGDSTNPLTSDTVRFEIYASGADVSSAQPVYRLSGTFTKGTSVTVR